ncbi:MAG: tetratricopeptide repeat protein, partial [Bacteroidota bacterium]
ILGCAFVQKGLLDSADSVATEMEQILKREQSDYTIEYLYNLRGRIHMGSGDYASAVREFKQALSIGQREQDQFRHDLAEAYSRMGDFENALATFREVFDFNPNYPKSHIALAELYERQQKPREAIEHYEKFLQIWKNAEKHHPLMRQAMDRLSTLRQEP